MKTVFEAIYQHLQGSAVDAVIGGRMFPIQAPSGTASPYVVFSIISELPRYALSHTFTDLLIEISVCADDATTMHNIAELVFTLFDNSELNLDGFYQVGTLERDSGQPLIMDGVYRYIIEYKLYLKNLS